MAYFSLARQSTVRLGGFVATPRHRGDPWWARIGGAALMAVAGPLVVSAPGHADDPPLHHVRYSVTAAQQFTVDIYFRDTDPPNWADYSHNPYQFSPKVEALVGPGTKWSLEVMLADPQQWAMVAATSGQSAATPQVHCELAVDGVVVAANAGPKGALCSLRHW